MKDGNVRVRDIIRFKFGNDILIGRVDAKGYKFLGCNVFYVLYVTVFDHPEWKNTTISADQVIEVIVLPEKVEFT